ncbi:MAG: hypothetical protein FJ356_05150 [Thaumarchaeota archaeon]|nr:hypothetical protein [Nitrososphaerota archaeon]
MTRKERSGLTSKQEHELEVLKSTYARFGFLDPMTLARLLRPEIFPYSNKNRLHSEVTEKILHTFRDIDGFFHYLDKKYQREIIASRAFQSLLETQILNSIEQDAQKLTQKKKLKQKEKEKLKKDYETLYRVYSSMLRIGLVGLQKLMPYEFQHILNSQTKPALDLMLAITNYTKRIQPKKKEFENIGFKPDEIGAPT